ncbi:DUF6538 domain-containing protein [Pseudomonas saliphila]|uniref:DUF6538 domain-containing protein n=1 Tax=Pseudomonas saliphila TaxID=2586906 RepID=UPI001239B197|nr:DUF6538 domain-containing protein [Pseudomonas saliphila]
MSYLERRKNRWYALLTIPQDVRHHFGDKLRFIKSTGTGDKQMAQARAFAMVVEWKAEIEKARGQTTESAIQHYALEVRDELRRLQAADEFDLYEVISGIVADKARELDRLGRPAEAQALVGVALAGHTLIAPSLHEWHSTLHLKEKTMDQMLSDAKLIAKHFETVEALTPERVREWVKLLMLPKEDGGNGYMPSSVKRIFSAGRNLWQYFEDHRQVSAGPMPFELPRSVRRLDNATQRKRKKGWVPFKPKEVVALHRAALEQGDAQLADLIWLGMYTGARIEELCSLQTANATTEALNIVDSKTEAGIRKVPVHTKLAPLVNRLIETSTDGYLLSGLTKNKYGDRSNAIGKRFGRLKSRLGYSEDHVFHSIRKTMVTLLENADVSENLAADIVGHDKPGLTYGLYSGGNVQETQRRAVELLAYPTS